MLARVTTSTARSDANESTSTTARANGAPTPTTQRGTTATTGVATSTALPHPVDGTYTYDLTLYTPAFDGEPASTETDTMRVTWKTTGATLESTEPYDSENPAAGGTVSTYRVSASALELTKTVERDEEDASTCAYASAQLVYKLPFVRGAKWRAEGSCKIGDGTERTVTDTEVTGSTTETIGGTKLNTFILKVVERYTETYPPDPDDPDDTGEFTTEVIRTVHVDPATLLVVREELKDDEGFTYTRVLRSLRPN